MKRRQSRSGGGFIERATMWSSGMDGDDAIRAKASDAPPFIKANIDARREARGMKPIWRTSAEWRSAGVFAPTTMPAAGRGFGNTSSRATKRPQPSSGYMFSGAVAPGTSQPVSVGTEGLLVREMIKPLAFADSLAAISAGRKVVELRDGHHGPVLASTADGTLAFDVEPFVGLVATAWVKDERCSVRLISDTIGRKTGLSLSFTPRRTSMTKDMRGRNVRVVHAADLDHVALCRPSTGLPAYETCVVAVPATKRNAWARATYRAVAVGSEIVLRQVAQGS